MKTAALSIFLGLFPTSAVAADALDLEGDWVGALIDADGDTSGAVTLGLDRETGRRASGPLALGIPGLEGTDFGTLDLTVSASGVVSGVAHSLVLVGDQEVQAQLTVHGDYIEATGAIIADVTLHLAGQGGETLMDQDFQRYLTTSYLSGRFPGVSFGGHDLGEYFGWYGYSGGDPLAEYLSRSSLDEYVFISSIGSWFGGADLGAYLGDQELDEFFGGLDMGEYFSPDVDYSGGDPVAEYSGGDPVAEYSGGDPVAEYSGGDPVAECVSEYFQGTDVTWDDLGTAKGTLSMGAFLSDSYLKSYSSGAAPSVVLDEGGSADLVLLMVPAAE